MTIDTVFGYFQMFLNTLQRHSRTNAALLRLRDFVTGNVAVENNKNGGIAYRKMGKLGQR